MADGAGVTSATENLNPVRTSSTLTDLAPAFVPRRTRRLAVLGDSTAVGLGDPLPGGSWRGFGPILADALGVEPDAMINTAVPGARMADVRHRQLRAALRHKPDVALVVVGMNDTLRSDFDANGIGRDLDAVLTAFRRIGTHVLCVRYHDHSRIFWLPNVLAVALRERISELNGVIDGVLRNRPGVGCADADADPRSYDMKAWSVDRLHPSEFGHRLLARQFAGLLSDAGFHVERPVSLQCQGGREITPVDHVGWLVFAGVPWLVRRGKDFLPYGAAIAGRAVAKSARQKLDDARVAVPEAWPWRAGAGRAERSVRCV